MKLIEIQFATQMECVWYSKDDTTLTVANDVVEEGSGRILSRVHGAFWRSR